MLHDAVLLYGDAFNSHPYPQAFISHCVAHKGDGLHDIHAAAGANNDSPASLLRQGSMAHIADIMRELCIRR